MPATPTWIAPPRKRRSSSRSLCAPSIEENSNAPSRSPGISSRTGGAPEPLGEQVRDERPADAAAQDDDPGWHRASPRLPHHEPREAVLLDDLEHLVAGLGDPGRDIGPRALVAR